MGTQQTPEEAGFGKGHLLHCGNTQGTAMDADTSKWGAGAVPFLGSSFWKWEGRLSAQGGA